MRILAKVDTKSEFVIKGVQLEGVEKVGHIDLYCMSWLDLV